MLKTVMEKVDKMQEQMDDVSREVETLLKNPKEMPEIKNTKNEEQKRMPLVGSLVDWSWPRKESVSLKIGQEVIHSELGD